MMKVMRITTKGKQSIPDPDAFKEKIKQLERAERRAAREKAKLDNEGLQSMKSTSSFGSSRFDQSQKTGLSGSVSAMSSNGANSDEEQGEGMTNFTRALDEDPLIQGLEKIFDESIEEVNMNGDAKISYLKRVVGKKPKNENV